MSSKLIVFCIVSLFSLFTAIGQDMTLNNIPNEIRLLPEDFKESYESDKYNYIEKTSFISKLKVWMLEKILRLFQIQGSSKKQSFDWGENIFYFLVIGFAVYLVVKMIIDKEGRWLFKRKQTKGAEIEYVIDQDIQSVNFDELIEKAVKNGDYRLAIKYHYFYLLKKLDEASIIKYDPQKTTYDYQLDLEGTKHTSVFSKAAYYYIYIWYGEFSIDANEYEMTSNTFTQLLKTLKDE